MALVQGLCSAYLAALVMQRLARVAHALLACKHRTQIHILAAHKLTLMKTKQFAWQLRGQAC